MDNNNNIINIKINSLSFLDSYRMFPFSLENLCKSLNIKNKKFIFDHNKINKDNLLINKDEISKYFINDFNCLYEVMKEIREKLHKEYNIDLNKVYSTSSLAMKIFITNYLKKPIPKLPKFLDNIIRQSNKGGMVDVYKCYSKDLYYYDINSLYPYVMLKPMPFNYLGF